MVICNDTTLSGILPIVKRILLLIQIFVPLLLIIWATIGFIQLIKNPEEKSGNKKIINKFIAAMVVFMIPVLLNATMYLVGEKTAFSSCWMDANEKISLSNQYSKINNQEKIPIYKDPNGYEKGEEEYSNTEWIAPNNLYGEALASRALFLSCSAIGTNYLTAEDAAKVGCKISGDGRLRVPDVEHSHKYRAEIPQTKNIIEFWDREKALNLGGIGWYGPASCSPWIGSMLRSMGYDNNIATKKAIQEAPISPWTGEKMTNAISAHGIGAYMYHHPESFYPVPVDSNKTIAEQCLPGDILVNASHIMIYTGNELAQKYFPGTTGDMAEAAEHGHCYPGVTKKGNSKVSSYMVFRVKNPATNLS